MVNTIVRPGSELKVEVFFRNLEEFELALNAVGTGEKWFAERIEEEKQHIIAACQGDIGASMKTFSGDRATIKRNLRQYAAHKFWMFVVKKVVV